MIILQSIIEALGVLVFLWFFIFVTWLRPAKNNIYLVGAGNNPWFPINGNFIPWFLSFIPLPRPTRIIPIELEWWEWVDEKGKMDDTVGNTIGGNRKDDRKYKEKMTFEMYPNGFIGKRKEWVPSLKVLEGLATAVEVLTSDGYTLYLIIGLVLRVNDAMKFAERPIIKMVANKEIETLLLNWAFNRNVEQIHNTNVNDIKNPDTGILISLPDDSPTKRSRIDLDEYLDQKYFLDLGCQNDDIFFKVIDSKESKRFFQLKQKQKEQKQLTENAKTVGETREAERAVELEDALQENMIIEDRYRSMQKGVKDLLADIYLGEAMVEGQRPNLLFESNRSTSKAAETLLSHTDEVLKSLHTSTSAKKFEKQEVKDEK